MSLQLHRNRENALQAGELLDWARRTFGLNRDDQGVLEFILTDLSHLEDFGTINLARAMESALRLTSTERTLVDDTPLGVYDPDARPDIGRL